MAHSLGGGRRKSAHGEAFDAVEYQNCPDRITINGFTIAISRKVARGIFGLLDVRAHEGEPFAHEFKEEAGQLLQQLTGEITTHERQ